MWFLNPGRDALYAVLNRILTPYIANLDLSKFEVGFWNGHFVLEDLQLKREALDKFRLPINVIEGHLGLLTVDIPWSNLTSKPAQITIEDIFLLATPAGESKFDLAEDERRAQAAKQEKLKNAELLQVQGQAELSPEEEQKNQGLIMSFITKLVNNLQVTVKNIHIRYEDNLSCPGHPFAVGITLAGFTATSVDGNWLPAFIQSNLGAIHKLSKLESLAIYFNTDCQSIAGLAPKESSDTFRKLVSKGQDLPEGHQFILKPVTGEGRVTLNHKLNKTTPKINVDLIFSEIGFILDDHQYRDAISLVDMYHFATRQAQYRKFRPPEEEITKIGKPKAMLKFAADAIMYEVHERKRKWSWDYFRERRDDRNAYVRLFKKQDAGPALVGDDAAKLEALEKKLSYEDIRFYRSITRSQVRKERATKRQQEEEERKKNPPSQGWLAWAWGSSASGNTTKGATEMTDEQRKELYEAIDFDEKEAVTASLSAPKDALKMRIAAKLQTGSFTLRTDPHGATKEVISSVFDGFEADFIQRPENFEAKMTLGGLRIHDGTAPDTLYPQIVRVKDGWEGDGKAKDPEAKADDPLLMIKFEHSPLDERADNAVTVKLKAMEIIYHRGYVEAIYQFLKPPESQLESVGALLDAANQTLDGIRKQTRAGLEFALQTHKTLDIKVDMSAPIVIIPEDIKSKNCQHLVLDAGHISAESDLVPKSATREIQMKRKKQYTDEDFQKLESLMYDKFFLKLESTQLVIGDNLDSCLAALSSDETDERELHLLERINIDFSVQISIVSDAVNLPRFKVSGKLPTLSMNLSNVKYKRLMRIVDIAIPRFGDGKEQAKAVAVPELVNKQDALRLQGGLFGGQEAPEYNVEDDDSTVVEEPTKEDKATGVVASATEQQLQIRQHIFEFGFEVGTLRARLSKASANGPDRAIAELVLERFLLGFVLTKFDMKVDINLRSISAHTMENGKPSSPLLTSSEDGQSIPQEQDLVRIKYHRVQKESPEYLTVHEGIDQTVDVELSTFIFSAAPEPVLYLYDFMMSTFVSNAPPPGSPPPPSLEPVPEHESPVIAPPEAEVDSGKIRVRVNLTSVQLILFNASNRLATLALSAANVALHLRDGALEVEGQLGNLSLTDDSPLATKSSAFKQILSIEGDDLAKFKYETFKHSDIKDGVSSSVQLRAGSLKFNFLEQPLADIYQFMVKFARLKGLYDAATQAAVQRASEIQRMKFDILVQSPILVFPVGPSESHDVLTMKLGQIVARNEYSGPVGKITAGLQGIRFTSTTHDKDDICELKIIEDVNISSDIIQTSDIDRKVNVDQPDTEIKVTMSDVKISLTQNQYCTLMAFSQAIPRVLTAPPPELTPTETRSTPVTPDITTPPNKSEQSGAAAVDLQPELSTIARTEGGVIHQYTSLDLVFTVSSVKLALFDDRAIRESDLKGCGIARFALDDTSLRFKSMSDGAAEAEVVLKSFTVSNTRVGNSRFREIIPARHNRDQAQFMVLYTSSGKGSEQSSLILVTIDSPNIIFAVDPVFAMLDFAMSAFPSNPVEPMPQDTAGVTKPVSSDTPSQLAFRVDLHDVSISILESDSDPESQAIQMTIKQILMSQQGILALTVNRLGMSLTKMGKASERVRFLDELDLTLSLDSRQSSSHQMTSIELAAQPIVLRASYRDINLISTISTHALQLYSSRTSQTPADKHASSRPKSKKTQSSNKTGRPNIQSTSSEAPRLLMSKERLKAAFDGFRLVLIGDIHELPLLHLKTKPFEVVVNDWSGELQASTTFATSIDYYNLTNSHWEPVLEPWTFSLSASKNDVAGPIAASLLSQERLDVNVTATFIELVVTTMAVWNKEGQRLLERSRGGDAPYRIRNRTGSPVVIWSEQDDSDTAGSSVSQKATLSDGDSTEWRFDDWKTMRERVSSSRVNSIWIQFDKKPWEPLRSIPVDREGAMVYTLRPKSSKVSDRLLCDVTVEENVKVVTLRSTYKVENHTLYPLELILVDENNKPVYSLQKIAPGRDFPLPIEAVTQNRIKIRPDAGFGYSWSSESLRWEDLIRSPRQTISCRFHDASEAPFRFQAWAVYDAADPTIRKYPIVTLRLRAPIELENLLPFDLRYRIYDKNTNQNWSSFLRRGGIMPVHSVQLDHLVLLNVDLQDAGFKPSEFAIINTDNPGDFDVEKQLTLVDKEGKKLNLQLFYEKYPDSGGAVKVQIYSPFIMINKTGLPFSLRPGSAKPVAGLTDNPALSTPSPFMFSHAQAKGTEFSVSVGGSAWSKVINFEAPTAETEIIMPSPSKNEEIRVGLSWGPGLGKYKPIKVVTLTPRFIVKNNLSEAILFREHGVPPTERSTLSPGERCNIHFMRMGEEKLLTVAYPGLNAQWSAPVNIQDIGTLHFRLFPPGEQRQSPRLIWADIEIQGAAIFVIISEDKGDWPFSIENESDYKVTFSQVDNRRTESPHQEPPTKYDLEPHAKMPYAWDYPSAQDKKIKLDINGQERLVDLLEIGVLPPFKFPITQGSRAISLDVRAEGATQTLTLSNYDEDRSLYKPKRQSTISRENSIRQDTLTGSDAFEAVTEDVPTNFSVTIDFKGIGVSVVNKRVIELIYLSCTDLKMEYVDTDAAQSVTVSCGSLQIDNQLHDGQYPIVLQPSPIPKENNGIDLPVIQTSVIILKDESHGVFFVKYASILLQAMTIQVDEDFLFAMLDMSKIKGASWEDEPVNAITEHPDDIPEPHGVAGGQVLYFEVLELQPIRLSLSFMRTERVNADEKLSLRNPLAVVLNALTMTLGNINDAPLRLNALGIKDARLTSPVLMERITYHYKQEVLRQLYRVLGSADFLGNPVGLFNNISSGVADVFYEPYRGVVMHGNKELGIGIAKGAASFVKKTVFGVTDSMTKVTSSIGKGLSAATFDSEYQRQRRLAQRQNKPRHAIYGVAAGAEALATSVTSGIEGVVLKPIEGAETGGASGFFKGLGKGLVGVVAKPMVGVFDLASNVTEGIRNTTTVFDAPRRDRVRIPRYIPYDSILAPYSQREAQGQSWMKDLEQGAYRDEFYVAHLELGGSDRVVLLTTMHVLCFWSTKLRLDWDLPFLKVEGVTIEDTGIRFAHKDGREQDRFIGIPKNGSKDWLFKQIEKVVKEYNVKRRLGR